jgi:hypothetical protein
MEPRMPQCALGGQQRQTDKKGRSKMDDRWTTDGRQKNGSSKNGRQQLVDNKETRVLGTVVESTSLHPPLQTHTYQLVLCVDVPVLCSHRVGLQCGSHVLDHLAVLRLPVRLGLCRCSSVSSKISGNGSNNGSGSSASINPTPVMTTVLTTAEGGGGGGGAKKKK